MCVCVCVCVCDGLCLYAGTSKRVRFHPSQSNPLSRLVQVPRPIATAQYKTKIYKNTKPVPNYHTLLHIIEPTRANTHSNARTYGHARTHAQIKQQRNERAVCCHGQTDVLCLCKRTSLAVCACAQCKRNIVYICLSIYLSIYLSMCVCVCVCVCVHIHNIHIKYVCVYI